MLQFALDLDISKNFYTRRLWHERIRPSKAGLAIRLIDVRATLWPRAAHTDVGHGGFTYSIWSANSSKASYVVLNYSLYSKTPWDIVKSMYGMVCSAPDVRRYCRNAPQKLVPFLG